MASSSGRWDPPRIYASQFLQGNPQAPPLLDAHPTVCQIIDLKGPPSSWLGCQLGIYGMGGMEQSCEVTPVCYPEGGIGEGSECWGSVVPTFPVFQQVRSVGMRLTSVQCSLTT